MNHGTRTAYDVEVVVDVFYPSESGFVSSELPTASEVPLGSVSLDGKSLRWTIPTLGGLQRESVAAHVTHRLVKTGLIYVYDNSSDPHEIFGEVTTESFDSNPENNTARIWSYNYNPTGVHHLFIQLTGQYSVDVTADELNPAPGEEVDFKITAYREDSSRRQYGSLPYIDLKVDIELTDGLTVTGTPTYAPTINRADSVSYSIGVFTIGTLQKGKERTISVTLPITVAANAVVNEQCLTATLTGNPPRQRTIRR